MTDHPAKKPTPRKSSPKKAAPEEAPPIRAPEPRITFDAEVIGRWSFIIGVVLVVAIALLPSSSLQIRWLIYPMLTVGLVGGATKISREEEIHFFALGISLVAFQSVFQSLFQSIPRVGIYINQIFTTLMFFVASALAAVIIKNVVRWFEPR